MGLATRANTDHGGRCEARPLAKPYRSPGVQQVVHLAERGHRRRQRGRTGHHARRGKIQGGGQPLCVDQHPPKQVDHLGQLTTDGVKLVALERTGILRRHGGYPAHLALLRHLLDEGHGGLLADLHDDVNVALSREQGSGHHLAFHGLAVDHHDRRIPTFDAKVARHTPEHAGRRVARPVLGNCRIDHQAREGRADTQDVLGRGLVDPGNGSGQPGSPGQTELRVLIASHVLDEHIGLAFVRLRVLLEGIDPVDDLHRPFAVAQHGFGDGRPRVWMQEDAAVLLEARRVGRRADARLHLLIGGRHDLDAVLGIQLVLDGLHGPGGPLGRREP